MEQFGEFLMLKSWSVGPFESLSHLDWIKLISFLKSTTNLDAHNLEKPVNRMTISYTFPHKHTLMVLCFLCSLADGVCVCVLHTVSYPDFFVPFPKVSSSECKLWLNEWIWNEQNK